MDILQRLPINVAHIVLDYWKFFHLLNINEEFSKLSFLLESDYYIDPIMYIEEKLVDVDKFEVLQDVSRYIIYNSIWINDRRDWKDFQRLKKFVSLLLVESKDDWDLSEYYYHQINQRRISNSVLIEEIKGIQRRTTSFSCTYYIKEKMSELTNKDRNREEKFQIIVDIIRYTLYNRELMEFYTYIRIKEIISNFLVRHKEWDMANYYYYRFNFRYIK